MKGDRTEPGPGGEGTPGGEGMGKPPGQPEREEYKEGRPDGDTECHGDAGFHAAMNVGHQPADQILDEEKRYDEPVEHLCGGPVLRTISHQIPLAGTLSSSQRSGRCLHYSIAGNKIDGFRTGQRRTPLQNHGLRRSDKTAAARDPHSYNVLTFLRI